jgi:cbb3-type cytochrome oxidase maturation protein
MVAITISVSIVVILFIVSAMAGVAAWFVFVWAIKDKQFENMEDVAERVTDLDAHDACEVKPTQFGAKT